ncbi:MAG: GTP-binding and nucleic acid-binding protein YchF, partial [uncultured Sphingomonas sp.]
GFQMRHRRPAQRGQVDPLQRADGNGRRPGCQLSLLHHRAQCRPGGSTGRAAAAHRSHRALGAGDRNADRVRGHRRPGPRRRAGRRARQPVPRQHPRGRRDRARAALLRRRRRDARRGPRRPPRRRGDGRDRADARRPRQPGTARTQPRQEGGAGRQGGQGRSLRARPGPGAAPPEQARAAGPTQGRGGGKGARPRAAADRQTGALRVQRRRGRRRRRQRAVAGRLRQGRGGGRARGGHLRGDRSRDRHHGPGRPRALPGRPRPHRDRPRPHHPRRLRAARPADLLHRRAQGVARLDGRARRQGSAGGGRDPFGLRTRLHPRRNHRLRGLPRLQRRGRRARGGQAALRGQGLCRPGRRRAAVSIQRV